MGLTIALLLALSASGLPPPPLLDELPSEEGAVDEKAAPDDSAPGPARGAPRRLSPTADSDADLEPWWQSPYSIFALQVGVGAVAAVAVAVVAAAVLFVPNFGPLLSLATLLLLLPAAVAVAETAVLNAVGDVTSAYGWPVVAGCAGFLVAHIGSVAVLVGATLASLFVTNTTGSLTDSPVPAGAVASAVVFGVAIVAGAFVLALELAACSTPALAGHITGAPKRRDPWLESSLRNGERVGVMHY